MNGSTSKRAEESITRLMRKVEAAKDWLVGRTHQRTNGSSSRQPVWPVLHGAYALGKDPGPVAVCTLTSSELVAPSVMLPGVAIAGRVYSANLGLEKMLINVTANPAIRFLLVCGKESPYFQVGQALSSLFANGVNSVGRILGSSGHMPELSQVDPNLIERFRKQVELVNWTGETGMEKLGSTIRELVLRDPGVFKSAAPENEAPALTQKNAVGFMPIRLGGHRESLAYDPKGYFIIGLDRQANDIQVHHYLPDNSPAHFVRGRNGETILLALVQEGLVTQLSHAGYLGAELAKAETALRVGLHYEQDKPLRQVQDPMTHV